MLAIHHALGGDYPSDLATAKDGVVLIQSFHVHKLNKDQAPDVGLLTGPKTAWFVASPDTSFVDANRGEALVFTGVEAHSYTLDALLALAARPTADLDALVVSAYIHYLIDQYRYFNQSTALQALNQQFDTIARLTAEIRRGLAEVDRMDEVEVP